MPEKYIGASILRREDARLLTGVGKFVDDIRLPDELHAAVLRSDHAHARIEGIDLSTARELPGVVAIYTADDIAPYQKPIPIRLFPLPGLERFLQYPLAQNKVRYVGEPMAFVVAESRYIAEDALDLIEVKYEPLPVVSNVHQALSGDILLHEDIGTNVSAEVRAEVGDVADAFRRADHVRKETFHVHRHTGIPLETRGLVATYEPGTGDLTVWGPTKVTHFNRNVLSSFLGIPVHQIHFVEPEVGGGFGIRGEFYPEDFLVPFAAMVLRRPIKWIEDRQEHLMGSNHARQQLWEVEIATTGDGTILGLRADVYADMGAFIRTHGGVPTGVAGWFPGPYKVPNYQCTVYCMMTNKMGTGTLRGPGRYESTFVRERLLDMVSADLDQDPVQVRLRNLIPPQEFPYDTGIALVTRSPIVYDSADGPLVLRRALEEAGYDSLIELQGKLIDGKYHGIGVGCFIEKTGSGSYEGARLAITSEGRVVVSLGIASLGQGHETTMAQVCADALSVPMDWITVLHGSTDLIPYGVGTFGSRGAWMAGSAIHIAAQELKERILAVAGRHAGISAGGLELVDGYVHRKREFETSLMSLAEVAEMAGPLGPPGTAGVQLESTAYFREDRLAYVPGTHIAHVAVDPETGQVDILSYLVVQDVGRCINPMIVRGQTVGGAAQGIGETMLEELVYDADGQLLTGSFMDYLLPQSTDIPPIKAVTLEVVKSPLNPLGIKGVGEGGLIATGGALANAVSQALKSFGVEVRELPLTPDRIRKLIQEGRAR